MPEGWECLARHEGGTVVALTTAMIGGEGTILFAATTTGLFSSVDGGRTWSPGGETPLPLLTVVAPSSRFTENRLLFAGTQTGCYRSRDAGRTWRPTLSGGRVFAIAVVPGVGGEECVFVGTQRDGILRSDNGGRTWTGANPGLLDLTVLALAFSPDAARDLTGFAATPSGLYRTRNGGKSWREVALPLDETAVQCVAISPAFSRDRLVFAGTERDGLWRSDDGGANWDAVSALPEGGIGAIAFSTRDEDAVCIAVATDSGVALSHDRGETWRLTGEALAPVLDLAVVPDGAGETLLAALYRDGVARLARAEAEGQWVPANAGLRATFLTTLIASSTFAEDRTLFVAGPEAGIRVSRDGGRVWVEAGLDDLLVYGMATSPDTESGHLLFAATDAGIYRSHDHGATWASPPSEAGFPVGIVAAGAAGDPGRVAAVAATLDGHLIVSNDGGARWRVLNTPFDGATIVALAYASGDTLNRQLYAGVIRPAPPAGTSEMTVWRSADGGASWTRWLDERGTGAIVPLAVAAAEHGNDALFVGVAGRVMQPRRNVWETRGGTRIPLWREAALVTDEGDPVSITALIVSPNFRADGMVFAATDAGVYRSCDRGRTFSRWSDGLAVRGILALAASSDAGEDSLLVSALGVDSTIWRRAGDG